MGEQSVVRNPVLGNPHLPDGQQTPSTDDPQWSFMTSVSQDGTHLMPLTPHQMLHDSGVIQSREPHAFRVPQGSDYVTDPMGVGLSTMSSFNWLSPTFDFDMEDYQVTDPQATLANVFAAIPYQSPGTLMSSLPWTGSSLARPQDHITPALSDSSYDVQDVNGSVVHPSADVDGPYYVDGTGARQPRSGKYAMSGTLSHWTESPRMSATEMLIGFEFPELDIPPDHLRTSSDLADYYTLDPEEYERMKSTFQELCLTPTPLFETYSSSNFPPLLAFNQLITSFMRYFNPTLPFLHPFTIKSNRMTWLLSLGMAAVGAQYVDFCGMRTIVALHEFLRRAIIKYTTSTTANISCDKLDIAQATLLNYVGLAYAGSTQFESFSSSSLDLLVNYIQTTLAGLSSSNGLGGNHAESSDEEWRTWVRVESSRRLVYCIWLLDVMGKVHFRTRPRLLLDFADIPLPCSEDAWEAMSVAQWRSVRCYDTASLSKALRVLYVEKRLLPRVGDFSRIVLIHGLFCQTWEIVNSLARPLLRWTPTARKEDVGALGLTEDTWLPKAPLYARWRNSACDCLDVLHWIANSDIARSGTENTTVMQLHFARIALLTPSEEIVDLVHSFLQGRYPHSSSSTDRNLQIVRKWALDDQYKARLSLIHAGVLFWHVRRYSADAFYEPNDVFLATLAVWAYGTFCPQTKSPDTTGGEGSESASDSAAITSIRLDRPTDDELVQLFIKRGRSMKATITGVGNIAGPKGPLRMLREGCKILTNLRNWGIRDRYVSILSSLASMYEKKAG